jgi:hypothetical protein
VVIPAAVRELLVAEPNPLADRVRGPEVERRADDRGELAVGIRVASTGV